MKTRVLSRHLLAGVGLVALMAASPANAAGSPPPPVPMEMWSWSGIYIGGHAGYGWARDPFSDAVFAGKAPAAPLSSISANGFLGGIQAGANWQAGSWVGGLEIDLSATHLNGSSSTTTGVLRSGPDSLIDTAQQTDNFDWLGSARVRLGYLPFPNVLLYGTGGPAWTRFAQTRSASVTETEVGFGSASFSTSDSAPSWRFGAVAGVGAEVRLGQTNWIGRVEYLHYDFGKSNTFASTDPDDEVVTSGNVHLDVVRAGLSYMLGGDLGGMAYGARRGGSAYAADMSVKAMPVKAPIAAPWTWAGFYIGAHGGYGWGHDPFSNPQQGFDSDITLTGIESRGFLGGIQAGGNWQNGAWIGGLEIDLSGSDIKGTNTYSVAINDPGMTGTDTLTQTDRFDLLGSARARVGYLARPDVLVYGTGGLAWTRMTQTLDENAAITAGGTPFATSAATVNWEFGWVAGIGVETRLWNTNWLGRIEYLHYDFGDSGSSFNVAGNFNQTSGHLTTDVLRAGLSYKLDWSNPAGALAMMMPVKAPLRVASSWSGFYLGGHVGYGWGHDPINDQISFSGAGFVVSDTLLFTGINAKGLLGGFQTGANRQMGALVAGLELDLSATGIKGSTTNVSPLGDVTETNTAKFDTLGSARARLGYLAWPNVLLYGTGGLAWTRFVKSDVETGINNVSGGSTPFWEVGWVAGAGAETRLWDSNWFWRLEYLHYDFGDSGGFSENESINTIINTGSASFTETTGHLTADVVRTGISFKLN